MKHESCSSHIQLLILCAKVAFEAENISQKKKRSGRLGTCSTSILRAPKKVRSGFPREPWSGLFLADRKKKSTCGFYDTGWYQPKTRARFQILHINPSARSWKLFGKDRWFVWAVHYKFNQIYLTVMVTGMLISTVSCPKNIWRTVKTVAHWSHTAYFIFTLASLWALCDTKASQNQFKWRWNQSVSFESISFNL